MIFYIFLIALLNLGIGFALAMHVERSRRPRVAEEADDSTPESDPPSTSTDAEGVESSETQAEEPSAEEAESLVEA